MLRRLALLAPLAAALVLAACSGDTPVTSRRSAPPLAASCAAGEMMGSDGLCHRI
jgi:hypothetical protein